jgi:hypothetical protein
VARVAAYSPGDSDTGIEKGGYEIGSENNTRGRGRPRRSDDRVALVEFDGHAEALAWALIKSRLFSSRTYVVKPDEIDILAFAVLGDFQQVEYS